MTDDEANRSVQPGSREIVKMCYLVDDARVAGGDWAARLGAGPFFVRSHIALEPFADPSLVFDHTSAFGRWGNVMVELMQVHELKPVSLHKIFLRPGLHHVTWFAPSLLEESERLEKLGWPVILSPTTTSGTTFTYHDSSRDLGHLVLIYERTPSSLAHYANVRGTSEGWDGTDPVRDA